jgi:ParB-like chromosome segregation protein Spo0J
MKVFPAADLFPMLPDDELQQLAEDIKAHGLHEPIVVALIDGEEMLVAGRNRLAACKIAGVEPTVRRLNGEDPTAYVISENIYRRHMTKGQRAMAVAMIIPEPEKGGRGKKGSKSVGEFSGEWLRQARTVRTYLPETAKAVLAGKPLTEAYKEALAVKASNESEGAKLERLKADAPDLAELVEADKLPVAEAIAVLDQREEQEKAAEENRRETLIRVSESTYRGIIAFASEEFTGSLIERLKDKKFRTAFMSRVRVIEGDPADFTEGATALAKVMQSLTKGD